MQIVNQRVLGCSLDLNGSCPVVGNSLYQDAVQCCPIVRVVINQTLGMSRAN